MNIFKQKFNKILLSEQQDVDLGQDNDAQAMQSGLDTGSDAADFNDVPDNPLNSLRQQQFGQTIGTIESWIGRVDEWIETLNGMGPESMNSLLHAADCDSVMADIRRSESKRISRLAQDLSALSESLKQYLLTAKQKKDSTETI